MPEDGYRSVSLPTDLVTAIEEWLSKHPELGYASIAEFVKTAIRDHAPEEIHYRELDRDARLDRLEQKIDELLARKVIA
jgi:Arc/MetJ-type ribon-helix-helix transcriptional regulator